MTNHFPEKAMFKKNTNAGKFTTQFALSWRLETAVYIVCGQRQYTTQNGMPFGKPSSPEYITFGARNSPRW